MLGKSEGLSYQISQQQLEQKYQTQKKRPSYHFVENKDFQRSAKKKTQPFQKKVTSYKEYIARDQNILSKEPLFQSQYFNNTDWRKSQPTSKVVTK